MIPDNLEKSLEKYFGYKEFRAGQKQIVESILEGENVIAILPTGAGKSLCYQLPALLARNFSIVISPLIALMKDQVDSLKPETGIAAFINSSMSFSEAESVLQDIALGKVKILYVAPERLENPSFAERIKSLNPSYLFVDEAHCISEWGHNFRPSYVKIKDFVAFTGIKKISAFTATATPEVVKDIAYQLGLKNAKLYVKGFERENLHLNVLITKKKNEKCLELLSSHKTPAIIYTASRKNAEEISEYLNTRQIKCGYYHAGLIPEMRKKVQEDFIEGKLPVIAATNAFGMGIDKKDIRLIIHYNTPGSVENFYQEIGRAGRDGLPSFTYLLHDDKDINIQNYFISNSYPDKKIIQKVYDALCDFGRVELGQQPEKDFPVNPEFISSYCGKELSKGILHSTLNALIQGEYIKIFSDYEKKDRITLNYSPAELKSFTKQIENPYLKETILLLLRQFGASLFSGEIRISVKDLSGNNELSDEQLIESLTILDNLGVINYKRYFGQNTFKLTRPRTEASHLRLDYQKINKNYLNAQKKLDQMIEFVYTSGCRFRFILDYFGQDVTDYKCGKCDRCTGETALNTDSTEYVKEIILRTLNEKSDPVSESMISRILRGTGKRVKLLEYSTFGLCSNYSKEELTTVLRYCISSGLIKRDSGKKEYLHLTTEGRNFLIKKGIVEEWDKKNADYESDLELYHLLREAREKASKKFSQTSYLICPDEILREVVRLKPSAKEELLSIEGFNHRMFNKLGNEFLEILKSYKNGKVPAASSEKPVKKLPENLAETYSLLKKGYSLAEISSIRKLSEAVISMQIETIIEYDNDADISNLFSEDLQKTVNAKLSEGITELKELKKSLPDEVSYPVIRIAKARYKANLRSTLSTAQHKQ